MKTPKGEWNGDEVSLLLMEDQGKVRSSGIVVSKWVVCHTVQIKFAAKKPLVAALCSGLC